MKRSNLDKFTELGQFELDGPSIRMLPLKFCKDNRVVVLGKTNRAANTPIVLGMLSPQNEVLLQELERRFNRKINPVRLNNYEIEKALRYGYGQPQSSENAIRYTGKDPGPSASPRELLDHILSEAVVKKASDIHLETYFGDVDLRVRIDGILHQVFTHITPDNINEIISRIKVLSGLDITERRKPQDGRFRSTVFHGGQRVTVDFRVSTVPSPAGEDVVMRVLDSSLGLIPVDQLGMPQAMKMVFLRLLSNPEGLILVTGPTGSGKTTTLYGALSHMRDAQRKIMTAEDPIEYYIDKINQKQVGNGMTMEELSKALLRQDPDVLLFGEIRDKTMGNTALMAAETGHVVLSTLHTSDAIGSVVRLRGLGLEDGDISNSLLGVVAQRLVRRVCRHCIEPTLPNNMQAAMLGELIEGIQFFEGRGCSRCHNTGYSGRIGVYELLLIDEGLQDLIADGAHKGALRRYVMGNGFRTMVDDALTKINAGLTTIDEFLRVLPYRQLILARQERMRKQALARANQEARTRQRPLQHHTPPVPPAPPAQTRPALRTKQPTPTKTIAPAKTTPAVQTATRQALESALTGKTTRRSKAPAEHPSLPSLLGEHDAVAMDPAGQESIHDLVDEALARDPSAQNQNMQKNAQNLEDQANPPGLQRARRTASAEALLHQEAQMGIAGPESMERMARRERSSSSADDAKTDLNASRTDSGSFGIRAELQVGVKPEDIGDQPGSAWLGGSREAEHQSRNEQSMDGRTTAEMAAVSMDAIMEEAKRIKAEIARANQEALSASPHLLTETMKRDDEE